MKRSNTVSTDTGNKSHKKAKQGSNDKENTVVGNTTQKSSVTDVSPTPSIQNPFRVPLQNVTNQRARVVRKEILDNKRTIGLTTSNRVTRIFKPTKPPLVPTSSKSPYIETQISPSSANFSGSGNVSHPASNGIGRTGNQEGIQRSSNISARIRKTLGSPPSVNSKTRQTKGRQGSNMTGQSNPTFPNTEDNQNRRQQTNTNEFVPPPRFIVEDHPEAYNNRYEMDSESESEHEDDENQTYTNYQAGESLINPSPQHIPQETNHTVTPPIIIGIQENGYYDDGDPVWNCKYCQAYMWFGERIGKRRRSSNPVFTMCCKNGKVVLPRLTNPPMELMYLLCKGDELSKHFREFIRAYNMMFSFTSLGGKIDHSINNGRGPFVFRMSGENYHRIGDIVPGPGESPKFSQLYIIDTLNEIRNRLDAYAGSDRAGAKNLRESVVLLLKNMLDQCNPHVQAFRSARDRFDVEGSTGYRMRLIESRQSDGRTHNLPTANEVAALISGDFVLNMEPRDIVLESTSGKLQMISELHPAYLPLQYPLLFPYREDGFRLNIPIGFEESTARKRKNVTMREYFAFQILERRWEAPTITRSGRLFHQFLVDAYTMIESSRLRYLWLNQKKLRSSSYDAIQKAAAKGGAKMAEQGSRIFIPATFTGGKRYMKQHYYDAMAMCNEDRPEILCRVFKIKLDNLISELTKKNGSLFGPTAAVMYTIEFQKRGMPHAHILVFMEKGSKFPTADDIDKIISAEIPDKTVDPDLYEIVGECMMHGPCGPAKKDNVCMVNGKCSKMFPKRLNPTTTIDPNGFPAYMRRIDGRFIEKNGIRLDNGYVVPYNRDLMLRYRAHMNVEWCVQTRAVKYLFKYIHKGPDYASAAMDMEDEDGVIDEIKTYYDCRYITACESSWRILAFPTHFRTTAVEKLGFHLPDQELVFFDEDEPIESILNKKTVNQSMFLAWFIANRKYPEARELTYAEFPTKFVWKSSTKEWVPRKRGFAIGRIAHIDPSDACFALGLMDDDKEFIEAIKEATDNSSATYARKLFARMLVSKTISQPHVVWEATWEYLTEDILYKKRRETGRPDMNLSIEQIKNIALTEIENHLLSNGRSLKKWPLMPKPEDFACYNGNRLIDDELNYVVEDQLKENERLMALITNEQRVVYNQILDAVLNDTGGVFFLYGYGGTGKTFVYRALSSAIRSRDADDFSTCKKMEPGSDRAELVKAAKLIVWDEAPMMSRHCFETLDRSMRDIIRSSEDKPFGGKVVVFGGDFRQILPVIVGGGRAETVLAALNSSYLWDHCKVLKLTKNMRLLAGLTDDAANELQSFSNWILDIGDGKINLPNDGQVEIDISSDLLIENDGGDPIDTMAKELPGEEKVYLSSDSIIPSDVDIQENVVYPAEFLNSVKVAGLPRHCLKLKVGAPIMCLRNIDVADGLCNGTRLIVTQLLPHVIEARVITGNNISGDKVWISRMFVTPPDAKFPFRMRRRQFPVTLAFAMTINKSQGQTLERVGLFLPRPVFSHGQLYVALSRVKSRSGLKILITGKDSKPQTKTLNVVYKQVFQNIP
ncbi:uncharacterized protein LOC108835628 [Raphanus sativus]|uniref:ATP-dependent DNA helicase n=1 Tax=Raphanus sativus TaxID=3726 RepID=A0A9W3D8D3_RAPSA|nr:uncharacterized protein LOC108835628 [Raphanus sativus]